MLHAAEQAADLDARLGSRSTGRIATCRTGQRRIRPRRGTGVRPPSSIGSSATVVQGSSRCALRRCAAALRRQRRSARSRTSMVHSYPRRGGFGSGGRTVDCRRAPPPQEAGRGRRRGGARGGSPRPVRAARQPSGERLPLPRPRERSGRVRGRPRRAHRCYAFGDPAPLSTEQQTKVCLDRGYGTCPRYSWRARHSDRRARGAPPPRAAHRAGRGGGTSGRTSAAQPGLAHPRPPRPAHPRRRSVCGGHRPASDRVPAPSGSATPSATASSTATGTPVPTGPTPTPASSPRPRRTCSTTTRSLSRPGRTRSSRSTTPARSHPGARRRVREPVVRRGG